MRQELGPLARIRECARLARRVGGFVASQMGHRPQGVGKAYGVALLHRGRCGSTVLGSLLSQHPRLYSDGEALLAPSPSERWFRRLQGARGQDPLRDAQALMQYAQGRHYVLSAKGRSGYPSLHALLRDLDRLGFARLVLLERRNPLRWLVSAEVGTHHRAWHRRKGHAPRLKPVRIPLTYAEGATLLDRLRGLRALNDGVKRQTADRAPLHLDYETHILPDPRIAYRAVCDYVGVEAAGVEVRHERTNPFPLHQVISNYAEVASSLRGTEFEWTLAE